jgi:6-phosphogluconolactonase
MKIKIFEEEIFFVETAKLLQSIAKKAIKKKGKCTVALAGGSTPQKLYELLITDDFRNQIDWENIYFFFGDERDVSPISAKSNFRLANEHLLAPLNIEKENIFRWQTEIINAVEVAQIYEKTIRKFFELENDEFPRFDLIFLGMGDDGHTASLFPFSDALLEKKKIVVANYVEKLDTNRLTFTYPTINNAANVVFTVTGSGKAKALKEVLEGENNCEKFPSQCVTVNNGELFWMVEKSAAQLLTD